MLEKYQMVTLSVPFHKCRQLRPGLFLIDLLVNVMTQFSTHNVPGSFNLFEEHLY